jgi:hypothetical protein
MRQLRPIVRVLFATAAFTAAACGTKVVPPQIEPPPAQIILPEDAPRHVDAIVAVLMPDLLLPVRAKLRAAKVDTPVKDSDTTYEVWLNAVGNAIYDGRPLPKDIDRLSERAYRDLAQVLGRPKKRQAADPDFGLLARKLHIYFEKQPEAIRRIVSSYFTAAYSITG